MISTITRAFKRCLRRSNPYLRTNEEQSPFDIPKELAGNIVEVSVPSVSSLGTIVKHYKHLERHALYIASHPPNRQSKVRNSTMLAA